MAVRSNWDFPTARIIAVDDTPLNLQLVCAVLEIGGYTDVVALRDGRSAIDAIVDDSPDLVLLDLHMPIVSGYDVLEEVGRRLPPDTFLPILAFTADSTFDARQRALDLGASDFITKPVQNVELLLRVRNFLRMRRMHLALQDQNVALEARVKNRTEEMTQARAESIDCLARALEYRDDATGEHTRRVGTMSAEIAAFLGLPDETSELISLAAPLHDLGKIGVSDTLLLKPGRYTPDEVESMRKHTTLGASIIGDCVSPVLKLAKEISHHHHERWDGTGYPDGLRGEEIPISCRIVAAADMFDALTSERPYKAAWSRSEALIEVREQSGKHLDPQVADAIVKLYG